MAEEGGGGGSPGTDALFFLLVLLFLAVIFFVSGAAKRANVQSLFVPFPGAATSTFDFIGVPSVDFGNGTAASSGVNPDETNTITSEIAAVQRDVAGLRALPNSAYTGKIAIISVWSSKGIRADDEYVVVRASINNKASITISGWKLQSAVSRLSANIPNGNDTYLQGYGYFKSEPIILKPGDEAIIATGPSPVGTSFRVNKCSGYLSQFQKFSPLLYTQCPRPQDELNAQPDRLLFADNECYDHLAALGQCRIELSPPLSLSRACQDFIYNKITYQGCVASHISDKDFKRPEWRVYLGYNTNLWREKREAVVLIDAENKLVDSYLY